VRSPAATTQLADEQKPAIRAIVADDGSDQPQLIALQAIAGCSRPAGAVIAYYEWVQRGSRRPADTHRR
jgi:hypothetical protein